VGFGNGQNECQGCFLEERIWDKCGQKFGSLKSVRHLQYSGKAFQVVKEERIATSVSSRIMVDAAQFRKINPNYARTSLIKAASSQSCDSIDLLD
jgi:hypothetical protein